MPNDKKVHDRTILLVEDNVQDELLTLRALRQNEIHNEVVVVRDGAEALDYLFCTGAFKDRPNNQMPELILLDLKLPKIDGHQVLKKIRSSAETRLVPVVILTTSNEARDIEQGYSAGANSYVRKPVSFDDFSEAVRALGRYWLKLNQSPVGA